MDRASFSEVLHFIDGERIASVDGSVLGNIEPATGEALGTIAAGGQAEVDLAVALIEENYKKLLQQNNLLL